MIFFVESSSWNNLTGKKCRKTRVVLRKRIWRDLILRTSLPSWTYRLIKQSRLNVKLRHFIRTRNYRLTDNFSMRRTFLRYWIKLINWMIWKIFQEISEPLKLGSSPVLSIQDWVQIVINPSGLSSPENNQNDNFNISPIYVFSNTILLFPDILTCSKP